MKLVAVDEKKDCPSDGARKPLLTEPRTTNRGSGCTRTVSLPSTVLPAVAPSGSSYWGIVKLLTLLPDP